MKNVFFIVLTAIFFISCAKDPRPTDPAEIMVKEESFGRISYLNLDINQTASSLPLNPKSVKFDGENLLKKRFGVLNLQKIPITKKEAFWAIDLYKNSKTKQYYGLNFKPIGDEWFDKQRANANINSFGTLLLPAITSTNTVLRNLPTDEPIFINPARAGEGYPFDYLQLSTISIGYPLLISHYSLDRAWAFVGSDNAWAWVRANDIKILSRDEADGSANSNFITVTQDKSPVYDTDGNFLFYGRIGAILPFTNEDEYKFYGRIHTQSGVKKYEISKQISSRYPLVFNDSNIKKLASSLISQPYGWGGFGDNRDCSLFTQDFLGGFGIWLARNSLAQSKIGRRISLTNLTNKEKLNIIQERGIPYLTLLHLPGHIMLYAGVKDGEAVAIHDIWGLKTKENGRALIGGVAITSLEIGHDRSDIESKNLLVSKIDSMNILVSPPILEEVIAKAYGVSVSDNLVKFNDGTSIVFNDGKIKDKEELLSNADAEDIFTEAYPLFEPLKLPENDAGRYRNYELLDKIYGSSESGVKANLVDVVWLKNSVDKTFKFNSKNGAAKALQAVSNELDELVGKEPEMLKFLDNPSGTFNWRVIAGTNRKSAHSYAIAIDINTDKSDYWRWSKDGAYKNQIPEQIVRIFEKHGFIWGGRWVSFDTMHFEYRPEFLYRW